MNKKISLTIIIFVVVALSAVWYQQSERPKARLASIGSPSGAVAAPDFTLPSTTGGNISLADFRGKKNVLLFFMEGVMCDPCFRQTADIEKAYDQFKRLDIQLLTITVDPLSALIKNVRRFGITLPILADEDLKISTKYDVLDDSMHPGSRPGHTFILVDKSGKIIWNKPYYLASGSTKMNMNGMTMDMGMDMGTSDSVMYLPVERLLGDLKTAMTAASQVSLTPALNMTDPNLSLQDHTMCLTPIHMHTDLKLYINGVAFDFSKRDHMDQSNEAHFHPTVKVKSEDVPNIPIGDIVHIHKESITIAKFLETLDFDSATRELLNGKNKAKVYVNGKLKPEGLGHVFGDKEQVLVTYGTESESEIARQIKSVTNHSILGKEKNPSLFGGC